jgi:hypothetical protein
MFDSNTTAPDPAPLDIDWAEDELVPFLQSVFSDKRKAAHLWMSDIHYARYNMDKIVSTVEHYTYQRSSS